MVGPITGLGIVLMIVLMVMRATGPELVRGTSMLNDTIKPLWPVVEITGWKWQWNPDT
jgi:hypothetical protein